MQTENKKVIIRLVDEDSKFDKVKLVEPNIKHNRCDIRYGKDFKLLEITYENKIKYISYYIDISTAILGVYMVEIPKYVFEQVIKFINYNHKICHFHFIQSLNSIKGTKKNMHWILNLPETWQEYENQFSSKHRYNRRYYKRKLEEKYHCEWKYLSRPEIDEKIIEKFFELKIAKKKECASADLKNPEEYLSSDFNKITDAYVLEIDGELKSIVLYSIIDDKVAYCHNMAYDMAFSKYNIGNELYYFSIKDLIKKGIKKIYLGGGNYAYKKNSKAIKNITYNGNIFILNFWQKLFSIFYEKKISKRITLVLFGIKMSFKL